MHPYPIFRHLKSKVSIGCIKISLTTSWFLTTSKNENAPLIDYRGFDTIELMLLVQMT
jgi:hypothetical protein